MIWLRTFYVELFYFFCKEREWVADEWNKFFYSTQLVRCVWWKTFWISFSFARVRKCNERNKILLPSDWMSFDQTYRSRWRLVLKLITRKKNPSEELCNKFFSRKKDDLLVFCLELLTKIFPQDPLPPPEKNSNAFVSLSSNFLCKMSGWKERVKNWKRSASG